MLTVTMTSTTCEIVNRIQWFLSTNVFNRIKVRYQIEKSSFRIWKWKCRNLNLFFLNYFYLLENHHHHFYSEPRHISHHINTKGKQTSNVSQFKVQTTAFIVFYITRMLVAHFGVLSIFYFVIFSFFSNKMDLLLLLLLFH